MLADSTEYSSEHNEPIRLYFYFRHAVYRAIPSLRGGYRDAKRRVHTSIRTIRMRIRIHEIVAELKQPVHCPAYHGKPLRRLASSYVARRVLADVDFAAVRRSYRKYHVDFRSKLEATSLLLDISDLT